MDSINQYLLSEESPLINNPHLQLVNFRFCGMTHYKASWASKQRYRLIWKLKKRKAYRNRIIVSILMIFSVLIVFVPILLLAVYLNNMLTSSLLGIMGGVLIYISFIVWTTVFKCDPDYITIKRRGIYL